MTHPRTVIVPLPPVQWGGLHAFVATLNNSLREFGWRWIVVAPPEATEVIERLRDSAVEVIEWPMWRFRRSIRLSLAALSKLTGDMSRLASLEAVKQSTIIQAVGAHHPHGALLARTLKKPLVWQIHSSILPPFFRRIAAPVISTLADSLMTNGHYVGEQFWGGALSRCKPFIFYAPLNEFDFRPNAGVREEMRSRLAYSPENIVVGTVGNRVWQKNHEFMIRAAEELKSLYPKLRFLILGAPLSSYDLAYQRSVVGPANDLNTRRPGYIKFVDPAREVNKWVQCIDIFTLTSRAEGVPIALFEAMCASKPAVCADVGSIREIVVEGETGFLYKPGAVSQYCLSIKALVNSSSRIIEMGVAARHRILTAFPLASVVRVHIDAYEAAIKSFSAKR